MTQPLATKTMKKKDSGLEGCLSALVYVNYVRLESTDVEDAHRLEEERHS